MAMTTSVQTPQRLGTPTGAPLTTPAAVSSATRSVTRLLRSSSSPFPSTPKATTTTTNTAATPTAATTASATTTPSRRTTPKAKLNLNFSAMKAAATTTPRRTPSTRTPLRPMPGGGVNGVTTPRSASNNSSAKKLLHGVYAMVDVRLGADAEIDCSSAVAKKLTDLGATIMKKKSGKLTHIVVSHYTPQWKEKVAKWHSLSTPLEVVSQLWVNACYTNKTRMKESAFFPVNKGTALTPARAMMGGSSGFGSLRSASAKKETTRKKLMAAGAATAAAAAGGSAVAPSMAALFRTNSLIASMATTPRAALAATRKRRALSMEPIGADHIRTLLENSKKLLRQASDTDVHSAMALLSTDDDPTTAQATTPQKRTRRVGKVATPPLTVRLRAEMKRRKSIASSSNVSKEITLRYVSQTSNESTGSSSTATDTVMAAGDCVAAESSCAEEEQTTHDENSGSSGELLSGEQLSTDDNDDSSNATTSAPSSSTTQILPEEPLASTVDSPSGPSKGEWACSICSCLNAKTRRQCKGCKASHVAAKTSVTNKTPVKKPTTPHDATPTPSRRVLGAPVTPRLSGSLGAAAPASHASSTAPSSTSSSTSKRPPLPGKRPATATGKRLRLSDSSTHSCNDIFTDEKLTVSTPQPPAKKQKTSPAFASTPQQSAKKKLRTTPPFASTPQPSSARKLKTTPPFASTPLASARKQNPSSFSTPQQSARKLRTSPGTACKSTASKFGPRAVIGITGVDSETRGVIECAVHGIDANMASEPGHRKARVVKSIDYAAGVTHLIVGPDTKRTIKVLFAIARGAWIVSQAWVFASLEQEHWLSEEEYELDVFPSRQSRVECDKRQVFRSLKFFVGPNIDPSREVVMSLIQCAGGEIVNHISVADYCICSDETLFRRAERTKIKAVTPKWVFDSIAHLTLEDEASYKVVSLAAADDQGEQVAQQ